VIPIKQDPPPEARDWHTIRQRKYAEYRRTYHEATYVPSTRRRDLKTFEDILKTAIQRLRRNYRRTNGLDMACGCWYQIYSADLDREWDQDLCARMPKSTWKRILKRLGWSTEIRYEYLFRQHRAYDDPRNKKMIVRIAHPTNVCPGNH
jgi:hypothetical protein